MNSDKRCSNKIHWKRLCYRILTYLLSSRYDVLLNSTYSKPANLYLKIVMVRKLAIKEMIYYLLWHTWVVWWLQITLIQSCANSYFDDISSPYPSSLHLTSFNSKAVDMIAPEFTNGLYGLPRLIWNYNSSLFVVNPVIWWYLLHDWKIDLTAMV